MGIEGFSCILMMTTMNTLAIFAVLLFSMMMTMMVVMVMTKVKLVHIFYEIGLEVMMMTFAMSDNSELQQWKIQVYLLGGKSQT